jgi:uncharacterized protein YjdB
MRRTRPLVVTVLTLAAAVLACYEDEPGGPAAPQATGATTRVLLTDAPFPYDSVAHVEVYVAAVRAYASADTGSGAAPGVTIATPRRRFDLLAYQQGNAIPIGEAALPPATYAAVSLTLNVDSSRLIDRTGQALPVRWGADGEITVHALVEQLLDVPAEGTEIVIDFDVGRSFRQDSAGGFDFIPWIRAVDRRATGSITGSVAAAGAQVASIPIMVYRAQAPTDTAAWQIAASGRTDASGRYTIAFLNPGEYVVRAVPLPGSPLAAQSRRVTVTAGATVAGQSFALTPLAVSSIEVSPPPDYLLVGQSIALGATPFGPARDPLTDAPVAWSSSDPTVVAVSSADRPPRNVGTVTGVAPGTARVTATYQGQSAYVDVVVRRTPVSTGDRVAGVRISATSLNLPSPTSFAAPVGGTLFLSAVAVDSLGAPLDMHPVTWSSSDPALLELYSTSTVDNHPGLRYAGGFRALAPGTVTVTASAAGHTGSATVVVSPASLARIELSPASLTVSRGEDAFFYAAAIDVTGVELQSSAVDWSSSDETVAAFRGVDGHQGRFAALRPGTVRITATSQGKSASATLTVR